MAALSNDAGSNALGFIDGNRGPIAPEGGDRFLVAMAERYGLTIEEVAEFLEEVGEELGGQRPIAHGNSEPSARLLKRGLRIIICAKTFRQQSFLLKCLMLALGWHDELDGIDSPTKLARHYGMTRANADRFACLFRDCLPDGLQALPSGAGQRSEGARSKFAAIRRKQVMANGPQKKPESNHN